MIPFASFSLATLPKYVLFGVPAALVAFVGAIVYYEYKKNQAAQLVYAPPPPPTVPGGQMGATYKPPAPHVTIVPIGGAPTGIALTSLMMAANNWPPCSPARARLLAAAHQPPDVGC